MNYGSDRPDHRRVLTGVWRSDPSDDLVFIN